MNTTVDFTKKSGKINISFQINFNFYMRKRTTKSQYTPSKVKISNKGPYHNYLTDRSTNVEIQTGYRNDLELSEVEYFQYIDRQDFFKKQHVNQLIIIKDQQQKIQTLKDENERLESLNQDLHDDVNYLQYSVNRLQNDIEDLNDLNKVKSNEIKDLSSKIKRIRRLVK